LKAVLVLVILCLAACNASGAASTVDSAETVAASEDRPSGDAQAVPTSPSPSPEPAPVPAPPPHSPPPSTPYAVAPADRYPKAKQLAAGVVEILTNYEPDTSFRSLVAKVARGRERRGVTLRAAKPLLRDGMWSRGRIVYPQLGGVTADRMSVMVVVEQRVGTARAEHTVTRTVDVRLRRDGKAWAFDTLASAGGTPVDRPDDLPAAAAAVVDDPRIELPDSAKWDIYRGTISGELLRQMAALADRTPYSVTTLSSGHPYHVFGTDRQSNHTRGRAVDVYAFDQRLVVDDRVNSSTTRTHVEWLLDRAEVAELGSPWALGTGRSFTNVVHQDHVHIAVAS
jgi:hypothetical protein